MHAMSDLNIDNDFSFLQKFLVLDEVEEMQSKSDGKSESVALKNFTASWSVVRIIEDF